MIIPYMHTYNINFVGLKVLLIVGIHGNELTPIDCLFRVQEFFENENNHMFLNHISKVTICNDINISAIKNNNRSYKSIDTTDLNRCFPIKEVKLQDIISQLKDLIKNHDVVIDIHSFSNLLNCVLLNSDPTYDVLKQWCVDSNVPYLCNPIDSSTIKNYVLSQNKLVITLELNNMDSVDYDSSINGKKQIFLLMSNCKNIYDDVCSNDMIEGCPTSDECGLMVKSLYEGMFEPIIELEHKYITKDTLLGYYYNFKHEELHKLYMPVNGNVIMISEYSWVNKGDIILYVQPI